MITHYVVDINNEEFFFRGSFDECCEIYQQDKMNRIVWGYTKNEIEQIPENQSFLTRTEIKGIELVKGWDARDNFVLFDKNGIEYHITYTELLTALQSHPKFNIEKKRVRRWLHP